MSTKYKKALAAIDVAEQAVSAYENEAQRHKHANVLHSSKGSKPYGSAGRSRPAWEHAYERNAHLFTEEERKIRTPENDMETLSFFDAVIKGDHSKLREIEDRQVRPDYQRADMSIGTGGPGMVPVAFHNQVQLLTLRSGAVRNRCTAIPMGGGEGSSKKVPTVTTDPVAAVYSEASDMTAGTEPVLSSVTPAPVKIGMVVMLSRELWDDTPLATVNLLADIITTSIIDVENYHIVNETPTDFSSNMMDDGTASADTMDDDAETLATLASKLYELPLSAINRATWLINVDAAKAITALSDTNARQVFTPFDNAPEYIGAEQGGQGLLLGRPVMVLPTATLPANNAIVGDLSAYCILDRETIRVEVDRGALFKNDQVGVHVSRRVDGVMAQATRIRVHPDS